MKQTMHARTTIERAQTGVRMEKRILKVLKAMAEYHDFTLGDLLEGIVLHAFEGKAPFGAASLKKIQQLRQVYGLDLTALDAHQLREGEAAPRRAPAVRPRRRSSAGKNKRD